MPGNCIALWEVALERRLPKPAQVFLDKMRETVVCLPLIDCLSAFVSFALLAFQRL